MNIESFLQDCKAGNYGLHWRGQTYIPTQLAAGWILKSTTSFRQLQVSLDGSVSETLANGQVRAITTLGAMKASPIKRKGPKTGVKPEHLVIGRFLTDGTTYKLRQVHGEYFTASLQGQIECVDLGKEWSGWVLTSEKRKLLVSKTGRIYDARNQDVSSISMLESDTRLHNRGWMKRQREKEVKERAMHEVSCKCAACAKLAVQQAEPLGSR